MSVVTTPSGSGRTSGSFLTPFIWNKLARTFAISVKKKIHLLATCTTSVVINFTHETCHIIIDSLILEYRPKRLLVKYEVLCPVENSYFYEDLL